MEKIVLKNRRLSKKEKKTKKKGKKKRIDIY